VNTKQTLATSMGGSCIELTRTSPVAVAAVKIEASQLPPSIERIVSLNCHTLQQMVKYLGFYFAIELATSVVAVKLAIIDPNLGSLSI
jgi:hypothetical protein